MKKAGGILFIGIMMALLVAYVSAQEMMEKTGEEKNVQPPMMRRGRMMGPMGRGPMMERGGMMGRGRMMGRRGQMPMRGHGGVMGRMGMIAGLADKLGLSEEQKGEINDILTTHRKDMISRNADREVAGVELQGLIRQEEPDLNPIEDQVRKIANLEASIRYSQIKVSIDVRNVLTEEQREELKKLLKDERGRMKGRRGARSGRPGPKRGSARHRR